MALSYLINFYKNKRRYRYLRRKKDYKYASLGYDRLGLGDVDISDEDEALAVAVTDFLKNHVDNFGVILDAACGFGIIFKELKKLNADYFVGLDLSYKTLLHSKQYGPCLLSIIENLPFKDKSFDLVICNATFEHLLDQDLGLKEFRRVLKDNGRLFIETDNTIWQFLSMIRNIFVSKKRRYNRLIQPIDDDFTYWRLQRMLEKAGFKITEFEGWGSLPVMGRFFARYFNTKRNTIFKFMVTRIVLLAKKS